MRKENSHQSEMVSQLLYGEFYKLIEKRKKWVKIRLEWDGYEGWIDQGQVHQISKKDYDKITQSKLKISTDLIHYITTKEDLLFPVLIGSDLRASKILKHQFEGGSERPKKSKKSLITTAYLFLNAPYLWGGKTPLGIDCSGFTQMIYRLNGKEIPRDANQQSEIGTTLSFIEESKEGDLAFFDNSEGKIIHVGIILEKNFIIHASGKVRIDRLDQQGIFNSKKRKHTHKLRLIKSIL